MSSKQKRILNLVVILGLLLVMLPQRSSTAQSVGVKPLPSGLLDDPNEILRLPYNGPEKELTYAIQSNQKVLSIAGWQFNPLNKECDSAFEDYDNGKIGPSGTISNQYCWLTYPLLLPAGATLDYVYFNFYDSDPSRDLMFFLHRFDDVGSEWEVLIYLDEIGAGAPGYDYVRADVYHELQIYDTYNFVVTFPKGADSNLLFSSVNVVYTEPSIFGLGFPAIQK